MQLNRGSWTGDRSSVGFVTYHYSVRASSVLAVRKVKLVYTSSFDDIPLGFGNWLCRKLSVYIVYSAGRPKPLRLAMGSRFA